jgi:hypothetical protein
LFGTAMREHGGRGRSKQEEGSMGGRRRYCACGGKFGTWLRRMLPPPTNNRASEAEGGGRAMADRKSVEEGGRTGMEYLRRKNVRKESSLRGRFKYQARDAGLMTQTMLLPPPIEPVPARSPGA